MTGYLGLTIGSHIPVFEQINLLLKMYLSLLCIALSVKISHYLKCHMRRQ